jgi:hypothetical protein
MILWSDRFKPHKDFLTARRDWIQKKWDDRKARQKGAIRRGLLGDALRKSLKRKEENS